MDNNILDGEVPMGFGMALAQNMQALERFAALSQTQKEKLIDGTHHIASKEEMRIYVNQIADGWFM